jgi:hypothetical protein
MSRPPTTHAAQLRPTLLWDVAPDAVDPKAHRSFLVGRVLGDGSVDDLCALRRDLGDAPIREYLTRTRGRRVDRRRLRYLEAILDLRRAEVDAWLADPARRIWDGR